MKKIKVQIVEVLKRVVEVEAEDYNDALDIVQDKYRKCDIVLTADDFVYNTFNIFDSARCCPMVSGKDYWMNEVVYQLDVLKENSDGFPDLTDSDRIIIAESVADSFLNDDHIWDRINESIDNYVYEAIKDNNLCRKEDNKTIDVKSSIFDSLSVDRTMFVQSDDGHIFKISEGIGDNLAQEDIDKGYVDYIYYDTYCSLADLNEDIIDDGGMILLKKLYKDMSVSEILKVVEDFAGVKFVNIRKENN